MYFHSKRFSAIFATADADGLIYCLAPERVYELNSRAREGFQKKQNKIVPEIRQTFEMFRCIYAIIAIEHVFRTLFFVGSPGRC